nr:uncharacterized protein LOC126531436 [Dermacentor andersoni]
MRYGVAVAIDAIHRWNWVGWPVAATEGEQVDNPCRKKTGQAASSLAPSNKRITNCRAAERSLWWPSPIVLLLPSRERVSACRLYRTTPAWFLSVAFKSFPKSMNRSHSEAANCGRLYTFWHLNYYRTATPSRDCAVITGGQEERDGGCCCLPAQRESTRNGKSDAAPRQTGRREWRRGSGPVWHLGAASVRACVCVQLQRRGQHPRRPDLGALDAFPEDGGGGTNGLK